MRTPGLKSPDAVLGELRSRLDKSWHRLVCGGVAWRPMLNLGTSELKGPRLREHWSAVHLDTLDWKDWADAAGDGITLAPRTVHYDRSTPQEIAAAVVVESVDDAARLLGAEWVNRLARARDRQEVLAERFSSLADPAWVLRTTDTWSDVDFDLLCRAARWFADPHPSGLTARQVPVEGLGTKWLDKRKTVVRRLAGVESLGLERGRPQRVHLTYLDPAYLASGAREHDLVTIGDADTVAYRPRVIVISENRDTAQLFPDIEGGIAIEGDGNGPGAIPLLDWIRSAETVFYWGDMDTKGLEILNDFRAALPGGVRSLFMDLTAYERWERFGVDHDHDGKPLKSKEPRAVDGLEPAERELYLALCSPAWARHRRVEQERIPLEEAAAVVNDGTAVGFASGTRKETHDDHS